MIHFYLFGNVSRCPSLVGHD